MNANALSSKHKVKSGPYFEFNHHDGADTLAVVFNGRNIRPPKFTFWKTFQSVHAHVIFLNCDIPNWFRDGVPGIAGGAPGVAAEIKKFQSETGARRLVTTGSSMGGYGALLYGALAGADEVLAFGVEPLLGVPGGKTEHTRNHLQFLYPDLTGFSKLPRTTVFYGGMDINDTLGAWLLWKRRRASLVSIQHAQHDTPDFLSRSTQLSECFYGLVNGNGIPGFDYGQGSGASDEVVRLLWKLNEYYVARDWKGVRRYLEKSIIDRSSPLLDHILAMSFYRLGDHRRARDQFTANLNSSRLFWETWLNLSASCLRLGMIEEAERYAVNAVKLRPIRSVAHSHLATVYRRLGRLKEAYEHCAWACKLNPGRTEYFSALAEVANLVRLPVLEPIALARSHKENSQLAIQLFADYELRSETAPSAAAQSASAGVLAV
ncbi:Flp pilus assembly protein TadD [Rhizobium petrolearium]|uniref:tetratricopeptide repeat protein n=1 Tax=Neorhizobium petrolearium TaxID=515361 RepID=UPI001AE100C0|nr:tetratricopeptide repeat protein [Neorhizobium petrolearium]MBP1842023.1 Flp pilus assembly protein TadD [Neorhizobium petrolearium]